MGYLRKFSISIRFFTKLQKIFITPFTVLQKKYQRSSQTVDIIEITSDLHRHEGVDQEYTAVYFLTTKCRDLHVCSMKLGTYTFFISLFLKVL